MKKSIGLTMTITASLALVACNSSEDASSDATAETVEAPAQEALEDVTDQPVEDTAAAVNPAEEVEGPPAVTEEVASEAAEEGASVAADAQSALDALDAAEAAEAAEAASGLDDVLDQVEDAADEAGI